MLGGQRLRVTSIQNLIKHLQGIIKKILKTNDDRTQMNMDDAHLVKEDKIHSHALLGENTHVVLRGVFSPAYKSKIAIPNSTFATATTRDSNSENRQG